MSEPSSPASSLDFFESDASADSDYDEAPRRTRKQPSKKYGARHGTSTPTASGSGSGTKIKINLSSLQRRAVEGNTAVEQEEEGDEDEEGYFDGLIGKRGVDLSGQTLKGDHSLRPLWVDDRGNMWVHESLDPTQQVIADHVWTVLLRPLLPLQSKRKISWLPFPSQYLGESSV